MFNAYPWGDYLTWAGPPGAGPFVTSHVHVIPAGVWRDYLAISRADSDCLDRLDRYQVRTALIDREEQSRLAAELDTDVRWSREYADEQAAIFTRRAPPE
jgi:hypothetical protein